MENFDLIVIGAGPGGYELAARQAARGQSVALIERNLLGGTCLNRGCIPTKCLCASAEKAGATADYAAAVERMQGIVDGLRQDVDTLTAKCTKINGEAKITPDGNVDVDGRILTAPKIIIATGSRPATLPIDGAGLCINSDQFLQLDHLPESVAVIGGGVIGLEFASIMSAFGVNVTVIEYCKEILPPFDRDIAKRLRTALTRRGIKFVLGAAVTSVADADGRRLVRFDGKKGSESVECDIVLMAVGRTPVVPEGLAEAGIETDRRGFIVVNDNMETTRPGIYAVGDCNGRLLLAHAASAQAHRAIGEEIDLRYIPSAVFTTPEAAMVGQTPEQLDAAGIQYAVGKAMYAGNGKARAMGATDGIVKVLYSPETDAILGVHILGAHAADLVAAATVAMHANLTCRQAGPAMVYGHPTLSELLLHAFTH